MRFYFKKYGTVFCKFRPGVFGYTSFTVPYENSLSYLLQAKIWVISLLFCSNVPFWESLKECDHHKLGNISQNSDFTARKMIWKKPKRPAMQTLNLQLAQWKEVTETCLEHSFPCALGISWCCLIIPSATTVFIFWMIITHFLCFRSFFCLHSDKMLENSILIPLYSKGYWFLSNFLIADSFCLVLDVAEESADDCWTSI